MPTRIYYGYNLQAFNNTNMMNKPLMQGSPMANSSSSFMNKSIIPPLMNGTSMGTRSTQMTNIEMNMMSLMQISMNMQNGNMGMMNKMNNSGIGDFNGMASDMNNTKKGNSNNNSTNNMERPVN